MTAGNTKNKNTMKQIEATPQRPFYSVCYQYERNPWTLFSCHRFTDDDRTMSGTDDFDLAKSTADKCLSEPGISYAQVSKTTDCYNHETVYQTGNYEYAKSTLGIYLQSKITPEPHNTKTP